MDHAEAHWAGFESAADPRDQPGAHRGYILLTDAAGRRTSHSGTMLVLAPDDWTFTCNNCELIVGYGSD